MCVFADSIAIYYVYSCLFLLTVLLLCIIMFVFCLQYCYYVYLCLFLLALLLLCIIMFVFADSIAIMYIYAKMDFGMSDASNSARLHFQK